MTKIFVISMHTETGEHRREKLKYKYEWFLAAEQALPFIKDKMIHFWSAGKKNRKGKEGVFDSYYRLLRKIYDEKIDDCIIAEDDCQLIEVPKVLPNKLCYLNGRFINASSWKKYNEFNNETGLHEIDYSKSRILGLLGIYIPKYSDIKPIIDMIENSNRLRAIDIMIMKHRLIKHYIYPACFYCDDGGYSQIGNKIVGITKNYK
tara:strand:+ start:688 stop:1302 length:615 start_codon:yes stop_codon:yes gene_type:complete